MAKSHYENLGVAVDANDHEIKRAYRAKARTMHPDKGGNTAEFAEIARAYEVLKDPSRRLLYDTTGMDKRPTIDIEVQSHLLQVFNEALASEKDIEILAYVRNAFEGGAKNVKDLEKKLKDRKKILVAKRKKITSKAQVNLVHMVIDEELKRIEGNLADLKHQEKVRKACLKALDSYDEDWQPPIMIQAQTTIYFHATANY